MNNNAIVLNWITEFKNIHIVSPLEQFMILDLWPNCKYTYGSILGLLFGLVIFICFILVSFNSAPVLGLVDSNFLYSINSDNKLSNLLYYNLSTTLVSNTNHDNSSFKLNKSTHILLIKYYTEITYNFVLNMCRDNIPINTNIYIPYVYFIFNIILLGNCIGLLPFSLTITSTFIITLFISMTTFIGINIIGILINGIKLFKMFLPQGVPLYIAPMLVIIEIFSYFIRVLSITIRLFANILAGHSLLKILITSIWYSMFSLLGWIPINIFIWFSIVPIFILECVIAVLQTYVFTLLITIYLNDVFNLH